MPLKRDNLSTRHQREGDAGRPKDTLDREQADRGRRAPARGSGAVTGSGAPDADYDDDPQGGNSGGPNPTGESEERAKLHKGNRTSA